MQLMLEFRLALLAKSGMARPHSVSACGDVMGHCEQGVRILTACTKEPLCNDSRRTCFQGVRRCETVLPNQCDWQYLSAMLIGYARVSTDETDGVTGNAIFDAGPSSRHASLWVQAATRWRVQNATLRHAR